MIKSTYTKSKKSYKVTFEIPTDQVGGKRDVRVLGTFNDWSWDGGLTMKESKGKYTATTELPAGNHKFRYLADGHDWKNDDSAESYTDSGHGTTNCCLNLEAKEAPAKQKDDKKKVTKKKDSKEADAAVSKSAKTEKTTAKAPKADEAKKTEKSAAKAKPAKGATKKEVAKKATKKDDLKKIEGIGPKIAGLLNDAGIATFAELSKATDKKLADVLQSAGARFRLAKPSTWKEQAKLAAAGKMEELSKLQDKLDGGVRK